MLRLYASTKFKRDLKACQKQGKDLALLEEVIQILRIPDTLPEKNVDHPLKGKYGNRRECHISPDWLLVYRVEKDILILERTGSHSDLFR